MDGIWKRVAGWIRRYGKEAAGIPSHRGSYEAPVPEALQKENGE